MRLSFALPLSLLSLVCATTVLADQAPLLDATFYNGSIQKAPVTLIDIISQSPNHQLLMRLLQRTKLIPTMNMLNNSVFFAPDDEAIQKQVEGTPYSLWDETLWGADQGSGGGRDNIQYELRQHLLYHLLPLPNFNASAEPRPPLTFPSANPESHSTLYYPGKPIQGPSPAPPPGSPWMPLPGGTLAKMPQKLRVVETDGVKLTAVDWKGEGGIPLTLVGEGSNGEVWSLNKVIPVPPNLGVVASSRPSLDFLTSNLPDALIQSLSDTANSTLLLPSSSAFSALTELERGWLQSGVADDDWALILDAHRAQNLGNGVVWVDGLKDGDFISGKTAEGSDITITREGDEVKVNGVPLEDRDIYASNGVLHTLPTLLLPTERLALTPEKTLVALNATAFVRMLHSANLTHYINGSGASKGQNYTILAMRDDDIARHDTDPPEDDDPDTPGNRNRTLAKRAAYHVLSGKLHSEDLKDGMLVKTELREEGLGYNKQMLKVGVANGGLTWGDARTLGEPLDASNVLIYFISHLLDPPPSSLLLATSRPHLSTFTTSLYSTKSDAVLARTASTTLLAPLNAAWEHAGLVGDWLLSGTKAARDDLVKVVRGHILADILYTADIKSEKPHQTLEGGLVGVGRIGTGNNIGVRVPDSNGEEGRMELREGEQDIGRDGLSRTGVVHEINTLLMPRSVDLTLGKMAKGARAEVMIRLMTKAGFSWVLDGEAPPLDNASMPFPFPLPPWDADDDDEENGPVVPPDVPYTLLLPTDSAFSSYNLTQLQSSRRALTRLVQQHLIPTITPPPPVLGGPPIVLTDDAQYRTLLSSAFKYGSVSFEASGKAPSSRRQQPTDESGWLVRTRANKPARVLRWGHASGAGGGVLLIDRVLDPYELTWWERMGPPVVFGAVAGVAILLFWGTVTYWWRRSGKSTGYEVLEGEED
ncbi:hypothetical protein CALVIDRAFT_531595 [Calocera viscosa TUFC12733]|uniref:FAS1 domain-containing protein n=1 Tax=Calocera viscosa (strain TUFC12733) TaxID=1330018 RepID=A0A167G6A2_CALVF|nr:hypothetical protein CALVIDRAFT_531595 [Calocera viscosa TUFC12733]